MHKRNREGNAAYSRRNTCGKVCGGRVRRGKVIAKAQSKRVRVSKTMLSVHWATWSKEDKFLQAVLGQRVMGAK